MTKEIATFDGREIGTDFYANITGTNFGAAAEKEYETVEVPGKSGDLHYPSNRFKNIEIVFFLRIFDNVVRNYLALSDFLASKDGYFRIEDSNFPEFYRMGEFKKIQDVQIDYGNNSGTMTVVFDAKPQKFMTLGEEVIEMKSSDSGKIILNETSFSSRPLLRVYTTAGGSGRIGDTVITVAKLSSGDYIDIDCDIEEAYKDDAANGRNESITLNDKKEFFELPPGESVVTLTNIDKLEITPRFYTI